MRFETTRWSVVARARGTTQNARAALKSLCRAYRPPVLAYIRARGYAIEAEREFERGWVLALADSALERLREKAVHAGRATVVDQLSEFLSEAPDEADYERAAAALNMRRNTVAVAVHRLRHRLRELVREQLMQTTTGADELAAELRELRAGLPVLHERAPAV